MRGLPRGEQQHCMFPCIATLLRCISINTVNLAHDSRKAHWQAMCGHQHAWADMHANVLPQQACKLHASMHGAWPRIRAGR